MSWAGADRTATQSSSAGARNDDAVDQTGFAIRVQCQAETCGATLQVGHGWLLSARKLPRESECCHHCAPHPLCPAASQETAVQMPQQAGLHTAHSHRAKAGCIVAGCGAQDTSVPNRQWGGPCALRRLQEVSCRRSCEPVQRPPLVLVLQCSGCKHAGSRLNGTVQRV
jgi:hypothetical protein